MGITLLLAVPILTVLLSWLQPQWAVWQHLLDTVLLEYVANSLILAMGVGLGTFVIGTSTAWLVVRYRFPFSSSLKWLLLLPLALPGYIIAYTYTGIMDFSGPVQTTLRHWFEWNYGDYWFPDIQTLPGAIILLSLVLYPYVYLLAKTSFAAQSENLLNAATGLGRTKAQFFVQVALPLARPALFTGTALAMMEAFADYGTVQYFGIPTLTTGIFRTWFGLNNGLAAAQLSACLCLFVLFVLVMEKRSRARKRYYEAGQKSQNIEPVDIQGFNKWIVATLVSLPFLLGFLFPAIQLLYWSFLTYETQLNPDFFALIGNSLLVAGIASLSIVLIAVILAYGKRLRAKPMVHVPVQLASMGYAIPGTVIAVGVMIPLSGFDRFINHFLEVNFDFSIGLLLSGTLFALLLAYSVRFLPVALHNIESGLQRIKPSMDEVSKSFGCSSSEILRRVHVPILKTSILSAMLLVFVDVLKELPATLILRPFNFNTLAVKTFELASDEQLTDAAMPALFIVGAGLLPVILLSKSIDSQGN